MVERCVPTGWRLAARWLLSALLGCGLVLFAARLSAADEDSEDDAESPYQNGLIARLVGSDGVEHVRLEDEVALSCDAAAPDRRVPAGAWQGRFEGRLHVQTAGTYRLRVFAAGTVRLEVNGRRLIDAHSAQPAWLDGEPIELAFGYHPLLIDYRRADEPARLALYWEGPNFELEPLAGRWLYHETSQTPPSAFADGQQLVRALRCAACHELPGEATALPAPALDAMAGSLSRDWLVGWLAAADSPAPAGETLHHRTRRMPHFRFERSEAEAVADYLLATAHKPTPRPLPAESELPADAKSKKKRKNEPPLEPPSAAVGATMFRSLGCLACHRVDQLGNDGLFGGGDLSRVAEKRPAGFFAAWLTDPAALNRHHRMPAFTLNAREVDSLSLYLQTLAQNPAAKEAPPAVSHERGRELVAQARCAACHQLGDSAPARPTTMVKLEPAAVDRAADSCLLEPDRAGKQPGNQLAPAERAAVQTFLAGIRAVPQPHTKAAPPERTGEQLLTESNCLACHARGRARGLAGFLPAIAEADAKLRDVLPALTPPALFGVGDKLHDEALLESIGGGLPSRRSWLRVRMPKFPLSDPERARLAQHLIDEDRIAPRPQTAAAEPTTVDATIEAAGARLVTADGFGCTSCHAIGKWQPAGVALNASGANLSQIGRRVRHAWFDRWVHNPARIVPQMEMPAVVKPARGVLDGRIDTQLAAVWQVLNRSGFTPPAPNALRVVRRANMPSISERAAVLTEVMHVGGRAMVKPLVIGLPNRHNVLFDLARGRLAAWWIGDAARQTTRGKTWVWEAGGAQLLDGDPRDATGCELVLLKDGQRIEPVAEGDYMTEYDLLEHVERGVRFEHRLRYKVDEQLRTVDVAQEFAPLEAAAGGAGFVRRVQCGGALSKVELIALPGDTKLADDGKSATLAGRGGSLRVSLRLPADARLTKTEGGAVVVLDHGENYVTRYELEYRADVTVDQFAPAAEIDRSVERLALDVVPGFEVVRLPVSDQAMPTGLAWRADGALVASSLEGRVWLGRDTDGDGLEDRLAPFSDDLAAPYGVATVGNAVDVINKYGLLRLTDSDGDDRVDRTELLASGWGHTLDYHDWAIGLPRDAQGNYYISLACQQDNRSEAGAKLRGSVARLAPREPSGDDPRRFAVEHVASGLRFANGIALSTAGDLFVTDNQGNYTPFNELNHVVPGARYGFINRLEAEAGLNPPFRPAAVEIPHPWTRSVNGICFLEAPAAVRERLGREPFGPFTGHLIGCEYDTRRLVRMSLERVGDDFQGAVYPFSSEPAAGAETFEGPLVCQVSPTGDLYVGNIRDSGWGAGSNTGSLVRLRFTGELPAGIAEVKAARDGFTIDFTTPVDRQRAARPENYAVSSYRRVPTPNYGGPDLDRRVEKVKSVTVSDDGRRATLELPELREGFVYEFHVRNLTAGKLFPAEAYYTLRKRMKAEG